MNLADLKLVGTRYRCPECESWQLSKRRRLGHIKCENCNSRVSPDEVLDSEGDDTLTFDTEVKRDNANPTVGLAATLDDLDPSDVGGESA